MEISLFFSNSWGHIPSYEKLRARPGLRLEKAVGIVAAHRNPSSHTLCQDAAEIDPSAVTVIYVRTTGGEVGAVSSLAPKIGPLGLVSICFPARKVAPYSRSHFIAQLHAS